MKPFSSILFLFALASSQAFALSIGEVQTRLKEAAPELPILGIRESAVPGFYEVELQGSQVIQVSVDGKYIVTGALFEIREKGLVNLTEAKMSGKRKDILSHMDKSEMVVFSPPADQVKGNIYVFTDLTCSFCRKLHQDVPELNRLGIAVNYLAWPRGGINSEGYKEIVSAWCADDPNKALTLAKLGKEIEEKTCDNPVARQYELGTEFGVDGTPALVLDDGTMVMGYRPPEALLQLVQNHE